MSTNGYDEALGKLREVRALLLDEKDNSSALMWVDTAILWREREVHLRIQIKNEASK